MSSESTVYVVPHPSTLIVVEETDSIVVVQEEIDVLEVASVGVQGAKGDKGDTGDTGDPGPQGPAGPPGGGNWAYVHDQMIPANPWTIVHNLNGYPNVSVVDSSNREVEGDIEYLDANNIRATFSSAFGGKAFLS